MGLACFWWASRRSSSRAATDTTTFPTPRPRVITTSTASLFEAVRGASFWTGYLTLGGPLYPGNLGAHLHRSLPIIGTTVVAALGLAGLARRGIPERLLPGRPASSSGCWPSPSATAGRWAVTGCAHASRPCSNTLRPAPQHQQVLPDVALPLALGLAWFVSTFAGDRWPLGPARQTARPVVRGELGSARWWSRARLVAASAPFWQSKLYPPWGLQRHPVLLELGARWLDAPIRPTARRCWCPGPSSRSTPGASPSTSHSPSTFPPTGVSAPSCRSGRTAMTRCSIRWSPPWTRASSPLAWPTILARAGFDYVVVRNDLNLRVTGAPPPAQVHQVLSETPGLQQVADFRSGDPAHPGHWSSLLRLRLAHRGPASALGRHLPGRPCRPRWCGPTRPATRSWSAALPVHSCRSSPQARWTTGRPSSPATPMEVRPPRRRSRQPGPTPTEINAATKPSG